MIIFTSMNKHIIWNAEDFLYLSKKLEFFDLNKYETSKTYREELKKYESYRELIDDKFYYHKKELFFSCILKFLTKETDDFVFIQDLFEICDNQTKLTNNFESDITQIQNFSIDKKTIGFSSLINEIVDYSNNYRFIIYDLDEPTKLTKEEELDEFQNSVKRIFLQLQEYSKTEH